MKSVNPIEIRAILKVPQQDPGKSILGSAFSHGSAWATVWTNQQQGDYSMVLCLTPIA